MHTDYSGTILKAKDRKTERAKKRPNPTLTSHWAPTPNPISPPFTNINPVIAPLANSRHTYAAFDSL